MLDYIAISGNISLYVNVLEQAAAIIVCLDDPLRAARLAAWPKRTARSRAC